MKRRVNMKLIPILRLLTIFFIMQGTTMNNDIPINEASGVGYTVDIFKLHTTHLRVKIKVIISSHNMFLT